MFIIHKGKQGRISKNGLNKFAKSSKITGLQNDQKIAEVQDESYKERLAFELCKLLVYIHIRPIQTTHFNFSEHICPIRVLNCGIIQI